MNLVAVVIHRVQDCGIGALRHIDCRMGAVRNAAAHGNLVTIDGDIGNQSTVRRFGRVLGIPEFLDRYRPYDDVLETRFCRIGLNSGEHLVEPDQTTAEHRVVP